MTKFNYLFSRADLTAQRPIIEQGRVKKGKIREETGKRNAHKQTTYYTRAIYIIWVII
jgi:hypothetical protein